jgi:FtsZ-binding cell division protein ZapB
MPVVKAVQEQQLEIGALKSENEELKKNNQLQQNDINNLKAEIEKIKKDLSYNKYFLFE